MARTSKYSEINNKVQSAEKIWQAALYVRLSREDGDKIESESVISQKALLQDFIAKQEDIDLYKIYVDDGWSGTNFERPQFLNMMEDMKEHKINCVIVKDLSRFGRNYIEAGQYLEKVFPLMGTRFISVSDSLDSVKNPSSMNNVFVPFKNIMNDEYCRDISNKVRSSLNIRRQQGKFIGSFAAFGYKKDPTDHNKLIIDEEAADVVRSIYNWFISGMSIMGITKKLNEMGILNPTSYKSSKGYNYKHNGGKKNDSMWPDSSVRRILKNEIYIGNMVQGKNKVISYKLQICKAVEEDSWIVVENTHEPIISKDTFEIAQSLFKRYTRTSSSKSEVSLFAGFVKCADCQRAMNKKTITQPYGIYQYYVCSSFKKMDKGACTKHTIRIDKLEKAVLKTIQTQIDLAVSMEELIEQINENEKTNKASERLLKALSAKEKDKENILKMKVDLYPDWKSGEISKEEYLALKVKLDEKLSDINNAIETIKNSIAETKNGIDNTNEFILSFLKYRNIKKLSREILVELIENIYIHEGGGITIQFKFSDAFEKVAEFIENNKDTLEIA